MGLFDFSKKKEVSVENQNRKVLLAKPIFNNSRSYELNKIVGHLKNFWELNITGISGDDEAAAFEINGEMVAIGFMPVPVPWGDIKGTAQYAYNWMTAEKDLKHHTGHAIVSLMSGKKSIVERFQIFSKLLCSILMTTTSVGIYQGNQSLLIPKKQYLENIEDLKEGNLPILAWIYIGLRESEKGNSAYTYGLTSFEKQEIEILNSEMGLEELHSLLANTALYVIKNNVVFKSGQTMGLTAEQKIKIISSKGKFVEGKSYKLEI
jgi:hypothetical protein